MKLNVLPGSELIGVSLNLRYGYDASAMVRPLVKTKMWKAFPFDSDSVHFNPDSNWFQKL
jgi:hypothetical protein